MTTKAFDLEELDQTDTADIPLVHPSTGEEIGASVTVYGQDSEVYRAESRKLETRYTEYARRNRGKVMPPEDRERLERGRIVACTKSINGLQRSGQPFTDPEEVFTKYPCFYEQTVTGIHERANFIKGLSTK